MHSLMWSSTASRMNSTTASTGVSAALTTVDRPLSGRNRKRAAVSPTARQSGPVRVVVVDDQTIVRRAIRALLEARPGIEVVGEAANGESALRIVPRLRPHVVLMDLVMPGQGGVETTRRITERGLDTRVLILTSFAGDVDTTLALQAGAQACVAKDADTNRLVRAIHHVARKGAGLPSDDAS
jgi:DNA-binding NarL/FixJ family response regulator